MAAPGSFRPQRFAPGLLALATVTISLSLNAQIWTEVSDAGDLLSSAEIPLGSGPLTHIVGSVALASDVDLYRITIVDFANFSANTVGGATFDTQLFLFNADGTGQVHNDDTAPGLQSTIGSQGVFSNGTYYLAISTRNADPRDNSPNNIFGNATYPGPLSQQRMPLAGAGPLASWSTSSSGGNYSIALTGACFPALGPHAANIGSSASSQSLTTAPNFAGGVAGFAGGVVYFTLEVASLMNLTGIDVNTSATVGNAIGADLYVNTVETDVTLLTGTSPALAAANWEPRGCMSGTAAGTGLPSHLSISLPVTLLPGHQYLMAIVGDFAHRYTNGNGANQTTSGPALTFIGGAASNDPFSNTNGFFSHCVFNATLHYQTTACGTNQLTTPPNFTGGNGGLIDGVLYFQLDITGGFGRSLCGIDVHAGEIPGAALTADLYVNYLETDITLLPGAPYLAAGNWCTLGSMTGISNGPGIPSPMVFSSPVDLPPSGSYVMAIAGLFTPFFSTGTASVSGGGVTFQSGHAGMSLGDVSRPNRILNATFHFDVPTSPITNFPLQALATPVGAGCGGEPAQIYEVFSAGTFDLVAGGGQDLLFNLAGGTLTTSMTSSTAIIPPVAADLGLGDDQNSALITLGFTVEGTCASTISVASNGYIWLGATGPADYSPSESEFVNEGARLAPYWTDLDPTAGGSIHVDLSPDLAIVTYDHVFLFNGTAPEVTAQVEIRPDSILVRYDPAGGAFADPVIVGLTNAVAPVATPGSVDMSGGAMPTTSWSIPLQLHSVGTPVLGFNTSFNTKGFPISSLGATLISIGPALAGAPLAPLTPPGCEQYVGSVFDPLELFFFTCEGSTTLSIPSNNSLAGVSFAVQSASVGAQILTSNGLDCRIGCF